MQNDFPSPPRVPMNSCAGCKRGKRKCDRARPTCSTCLRVGRTCLYEEDNFRSPFDVVSPRQAGPLTGGSSTTSGASSSGSPGSFVSVSDVGTSISSRGAFMVSPLGAAIDPFAYESLRQPTVDLAVGAEALKALKSFENMYAIANKYFNTISTRILILSAKKFFARLPTLSQTSRADFTALCLAVHLILQEPPAGCESMRTSLYVSIKNIVSLLEAAGYDTLEVVQTRILVGFYEMGHGIFPAASISIGGAARAARAIGLHRRNLGLVDNDFDDAKIGIEERRRAWWALHNMDRFLGLCNCEALFSTEDPELTDPLPIPDSIWATNTIPDVAPATLDSASSCIMGQFARESQVSHLVGRITRHVFDPVKDEAFKAEEARQLEAVCMAYIPLIFDEEVKNGKYCAALGMACSALFTLFRYTKVTNTQILDDYAVLEPLLSQVYKFARHVFQAPGQVDIRIMSPYVSYALYQAAVVHARMWQQTGQAEYKDGLEFLREALVCFKRRWFIAQKYLDLLQTETLPLIFPGPSAGQVV